MSRPIPEQAYQEFVDTLGERNVSTDPGVMETYTYMNGLAQGAFGFHWHIRPVCVVLPETTDHVVSIINTCREHRLKFKAHSTAWWMNSLATCKNTVIVDMRRMDKLTIDEKDWLCVTESYATAGASQVEAMKKGLTPHLVGAGPNASNLASCTSMQGTGGMSVRTSMNERNVLAVEWVTPQGEILKLGSLNTPGAGWFCGDGPGPSLRGMMRGATGNNGGNGIFTRCGTKLYPWYGKPFKSGGTPPFFDSELPENSYLMLVIWPGPEEEGEALHLLGEAEIIDYNNRWADGAFTSAMSTSNSEYLEMQAAEPYKKFENGYWTFFMRAPSERALKYRIKTFEEIVKNTQGELMDPMEYGKPSFEIAMQNSIKGQWIAKSAYMPCSANTGSLPMAYETIDQCFKHALPISLQAKKDILDDDLIFNEGIDNCYACIDEDGHYIHIEHAALVDPWEPKNEPMGAIVRGMVEALRQNIGPMYASQPGSPKDTVIYMKYMVGIQKLLDPESVADNQMLRGLMSVMADE